MKNLFITTCLLSVFCPSLFAKELAQGFKAGYRPEVIVQQEVNIQVTRELCIQSLFIAYKRNFRCVIDVTPSKIGLPSGGRIVSNNPILEDSSHYDTIVKNMKINGKLTRVVELKAKKNLNKKIDFRSYLNSEFIDATLWYHGKQISNN